MLSFLRGFFFCTEGVTASMATVAFFVKLARAAGLYGAPVTWFDGVLLAALVYLLVDYFPRALRRGDAARLKAETETCGRERSSGPCCSASEASLRV